MRRMPAADKKSDDGCTFCTIHRRIFFVQYFIDYIFFPNTQRALCCSFSKGRHIL